MIMMIITMITWMTQFIIIKEVEVNALPRVVGVGGDPPGVPVHLTMMIRGGFKNPRHGNFPLEGYPPPRGLHGREFSEKLAEKS